jgi:hypothetical protein
VDKQRTRWQRPNIPRWKLRGQGRLEIMLSIPWLRWLWIGKEPGGRGQIYPGGGYEVRVDLK